MTTCRAKFVAAAIALVSISAPFAGSADEAHAVADRTLVLSIGDSYMAGNGVGHHYDGQGPGHADIGGPRVPAPGRNCFQSYASYPWQYVQMLRDEGRAADIWHAACGGAWTYDLWDQFWTMPGHVRADADVVLVSAGGNDAGFGAIVAHCLLGLHGWMPGVPSGTCDGDLDHAERELPRVVERLRRTVLDLAPHLPDTVSVIVVGYPGLGSQDCANARGEARLAALQRLHDESLVELARSLTAAGVATTAVLPSDRFAGHGPCSGDRWIHGLSWTEGHSFHPTWWGAHELARLLHESTVAAR